MTREHEEEIDPQIALLESAINYGKQNERRHRDELKAAKEREQQLELSNMTLRKALTSVIERAAKALE